MTDHLLALIAAHFACADISETRQMSWSEVHFCNAINQDIKLEFVPGIDRDAFRALSIEDRFAVSQQGFQAFITWRTENPDRVAYLQNVAKGEVKLGVAL